MRGYIYLIANLSSGPMTNKKGDLYTSRVVENKKDVNEDNDEEEELWCHKLNTWAGKIKVYCNLLPYTPTFQFLVKQLKKGDSSEELYVRGGETLYKKGGVRGEPR